MMSKMHSADRSATLKYVFSQPLGFFLLFWRIPEYLKVGQAFLTPVGRVGEDESSEKLSFFLEFKF